MGNLEERGAGIQLLLLDIDGVITDGKLYHGPDGQEFKTSSVRDGHGLVMLRKAGFEIGVISGRPSQAMEERMSGLGVRHAFFAVRDKIGVYHALLDQLQLKPEQTAFMGDDEPDLAVMQVSGLAMAPADAHSSALEAADWVSRCRGGEGAVREACDWLIRCKTV